jgi:hypothetical protein
MSRVKIRLHYLLLASFLASVATSCNEGGDNDHPGDQTSKDVDPPDLIDGRQEKLIPESRNRPSESKEN